MLFDFLSKKKKSWLKVDLHSHLIPGIDDGVKTIEDAIGILKQLSYVGIEKVITTPHIAMEFYPNTPEIIKEGLLKVKRAIKEQHINIRLEAAAEYYMDQHFLNMLINGDEIMTFGDNYLLFETPFFNKPHFFDQVLFEMSSRGFKPILAHPERYQYMIDEPEILFELKQKNILLQVNAGSLIGYYGSDKKKMANWMLKNKLIDFLGSDIHNRKHLKSFIEFRNDKQYQKLMSLPLLNDNLLL